jgi:hypothetical protein
VGLVCAAAATFSAGSAALRTIDVGETVLLAPRMKTSGCTLGAYPDRACSPGAYYSKLTKAVICSSSFRTSAIRHVPQSEKYGMVARSYGRMLEIDHIVSLELGGSNDIANLFPEKAAAHPGYRVKDRLENKLHDLVCAGDTGRSSEPLRWADSTPWRRAGLIALWRGSRAAQIPELEEQARGRSRDGRREVEEPA